MEPHSGYDSENYKSIYNFEKPSGNTASSPAVHSRPSLGSGYGDRWKDSRSDADDGDNAGLLNKFVLGASYAGLALTFPISLPFCLKYLSTEEKAVISRAGGKLVEKEDSGYYISIPGLDTFEKFTRIPIKFTLQTTAAVTKDRWELAIQGSAAYKINEPLRLVKNAQADHHRLIHDLTKSSISAVAGRYNYERIKDTLALRNEVLLETNRTAQQLWGIQLVTDELRLTIEIIKRGDDGPGDPMEQIITLIKDQFDLGDKSQTGAPAGMAALAQAIYAQHPSASATPNETSETPTTQSLAEVMQPLLSGITVFPSSAVAPMGSLRDEQVISSTPMGHGNSERLPELDLTAMPMLMDLEKYTSSKAQKQFDALKGQVYKITVVDKSFSFVVDGTDSNQPVKIRDYTACTVGVTVGLESKYIPKLLQHEYDALKVYMAGNISISGTNDVNSVVAVGRFLKHLLQ